MEAAPHISITKPLTIAAHGHTALYVDGNVNGTAALTFQVDPTATLDLFIAGNLNEYAPLALGSTSSPAQCRAYVGGTTVDLRAGSSLGCNLYAPTAAFNTSNAANPSASSKGYDALRQVAWTLLRDP